MNAGPREDEAAVAEWDVVVVGRSYGGLSAALTLGRARKSVLLVGAGGPRNESVEHVHGMLTRDGASPAELIDVASAELERYPTVHTVTARVDRIVRHHGVFDVSFGGHRATAARVILATGSNDNPPGIPGLADVWGRGVFTCPYCDGYENADAPLGVIGDAELVGHLATLLRNWSTDVTVFSDELTETCVQRLSGLGVRIDPRAIARVHQEAERLASIELVDGTSIALQAIFVAAIAVPNNDLAVQLGCVIDDRGFVAVDDSGTTSAPHVWAVGDLTSMQKNMTIAIVDGVRAGVACSASLGLRG